MKTISVAWMDSAGLKDIGWVSEDTIDEFDVSTIISVGLLYREDETKIVLVMSDDGQGHYSQVMAIPKSCIIHMVVLQDDLEDAIEIL